MKRNENVEAGPVRSISLGPSRGVAPTIAYIQLVKPRLVSLVLLSIGAAFHLSAPTSVDWLRFLVVVSASLLVGFGAMALNEVLERDVDAKMTRTQGRPIPSGRLSAGQALRFGVALSVAGIGALALWANLLSAVIAFLTLTSYLFAYTPLKKKTSLATLVGAVPGAMPVLIGWAGSQGALNIQAVSLFLIVFFWQMPHFLSIAWMYRDDYRAAGLKTLSVLDNGAIVVARQMMVYVCALIPVSLLPTIFGMSGPVYFFSAFGLGIAFSAIIIFSAADLNRRARLVLRGSILYLTLLFIIMMMDKV
jgi:heme o synthase